MACPTCGKGSVCNYTNLETIKGLSTYHVCSKKRLAKIEAERRRESESDSAQERCETFSCKLDEGFGMMEHDDAPEAVRRRFAD